MNQINNDGQWTELSLDKSNSTGKLHLRQDGSVEDRNGNTNSEFNKQIIQKLEQVSFKEITKEIIEKINSES